MTGPERPECWYLLNNGTLLMESTDSESGDAFFFQLQSARQVEPEDLRTHDEQTVKHLTRFGSRWSLILSMGLKLFLFLLVAVGAGALLAQFDATERAGGWMFWLSIPIAVLVYLAMKVGDWRLESGIKKIQQDAGLVPGMIDEIEHPRGLELIETHGIAFKMERNNSTS